MTQLDTDADITALRQRVSRRDENARAAMQGFISEGGAYYAAHEGRMLEMARWSYRIADAMERARNEGMSE